MKPNTVVSVRRAASIAIITATLGIIVCLAYWGWSNPTSMLEGYNDLGGRIDDCLFAIFVTSCIGLLVLVGVWNLIEKTTHTEYLDAWISLIGSAETFPVSQKQKMLLEKWAWALLTALANEANNLFQERDSYRDKLREKRFVPADTIGTGVSFAISTLTYLEAMAEAVNRKYLRTFDLFVGVGILSIELRDYPRKFRESLPRQAAEQHSAT